MNENTINELLKKISMNMMEYSDGDLLLISNFIDDIDDLKKQLIDYKFFDGIIIIIYGVLKRLLNGEKVEKFDDIISDGIDLIKKAVDYILLQKENFKNISDLLDNEINNYHEKNIKFISEDNVLKSDVNKKEKIKKNEYKEKNIDNKEEQKKIQTQLDSFRIFIAEAEEKIIKAQDLILKIEEDLSNKELLNEIFRIFHTIKGECGFLHIASLGELAHNLENILDLIRNDELKNSSTIIDILLEGIDYAKKMLEALKAGNIVVFNKIEIDDLLIKIKNSINIVKPELGEILVDEGKLTETEVYKVLQTQKESSFTKKFGEIAVEKNLLTEDDIEESLQKQKAKEADRERIGKIEQIIKVKASQINYLVDMVGELLIIESQLDDSDKNIALIKKITKNIQIAAMQLRAIKISNLFINMRRVIRDTARKIKKNIETVIIGDELEIDRNLVENLDEPLIHILRNAVSHGIESEEERKKKNKNPIGRVILKAERRGNNILISIVDDGKGIDEELVLKKALSRSLISKDSISSLTKNQIYDFLFLPGFSTAESIDNVSGRGVGLDVVKKFVTDFRGQIEIKSEKDKFTEISLIFPISMAIIDGMIVKAQNTHFIIPVMNIIESLEIKNNMIHKAKDMINFIDLRQEIIPIIELVDFFNIESILESERKLAVIIENREKKYAFLINEIIAKKEIVIKPLGNKFKKLKGISSGTILQGGKIGFILDIDEIVTNKQQEVSFVKEG